VGLGGVGGGEMPLTMYAHMNKRIIIIKRKKRYNQKIKI
jgi:hypothetical protein